MSGEIFVAKGGAVLVLGDKRIVLQQGQTVREGHPILAGREQLFEPFTVDYEVEDAQKSEAPPKAPEVKKQDAPKEPDAKAVRAWAAENGVEVPARGKLPAEVVEQYVAAHPEA
jgi:hypothetical protein